MGCDMRTFWLPVKTTFWATSKDAQWIKEFHYTRVYAKDVPFIGNKLLKEDISAFVKLSPNLLITESWILKLSQNYQKMHQICADK